MGLLTSYLLLFLLEFFICTMVLGFCDISGGNFLFNPQSEIMISVVWHNGNCPCLVISPDWYVVQGCSGI